MKVTLSTSGGFAATIRSKDRVVDTDRLGEAEADRLRSLAGQVANAPKPRGNPNARDARTYELTIADDNGATTTVEQTDGEMTPEFADLMRIVRENG